MRMNSAETTQPGPILARAGVATQAFPIMLANAAVPLLGLVDTAALGRSGRLEDLAAMALGTLVFSFAYWTFGFLRMGTTGFVAQADGRGEGLLLRTTVARAVMLGVALGLGLILCQAPLADLSFALLSGESAVERPARHYVLARLWGAPATLGTFALMGTFIGLGRGRIVLLVQLLLTGLNMALDLWFVLGFGWGVRGVAWGTAIAEWCAFLVALVLCYRLLGASRGPSEPWVSWPALRSRAAFTVMMRANGDIMVRTLFLLLAFGFFTNRGAAFGSDVLAGNHILLQFISLSAFFLDGFAHVVEQHVGVAKGRGDLALFDRAVRLTLELSAATALGLAALIAFGGAQGIATVTDLSEVRAAALRHLPWAAGYVLLSFGAFLLDGVFIGATRTTAMRNASVWSCLAFLAVGWVLSGAYGNHGLWMAFLGYVVLRALALWAHYGGLRQSIRKD